jgi:hypothetical protein
MGSLADIAGAAKGAGRATGQDQRGERQHDIDDGKVGLSHDNTGPSLIKMNHDAAFAHSAPIILVSTHETLTSESGLGDYVVTERKRIRNRVRKRDGPFRGKALRAAVA